MKQRLTVLEAFFLLMGTATVVHQLVVVHNDLTLGVLGWVLFCFGYVISSVADREGTRGPIDFLKTVAEIIGTARGRGLDS